MMAVPGSSEVQRAAVLADQTRARLHRLLRRHAEGLDAATIARELHLHHTTVRDHLRQLAAVGLIDSEQLPPSGRGRPRTVYRARPLPGGPYRTLSSLLASAVRHGLSPRAAGQLAGLRAVEQAGGQRSALDLLVAEAEELGFEPVVRRHGTEVVLRSCPFAEVAATDPETICAVHLGLAEGIADAAGGAVVEALHVTDPHRGGCRIVIRTDGSGEVPSPRLSAARRGSAAP